ncbi:MULTISPECIES: hypothetical protein [unclassified Mesorhizobium]|uniref:hypothetical protein n=1 Tax=unclassified Mesorhizobium TaxID=325217 RepID=UPI001093A5A9|nr:MULTISPECIES: hypothetical protein [unclassified Mesorhizobium]TGS46015.1 hypothetical protein EN825_10340 [Mesorhizobium sp. M8A.F.Ca.ET.182.01.1.1]TGS81470.1 hypothetical protein EN824_10555 [Mesorhizobium sp. M8A.F.Ca.ET.181.01.1.1]
MEQIDLQPDEMIRQAAEYVAGPRERTGLATIPEIRERFGLNALQACEAVRRAQALRYARAL